VKQVCANLLVFQNRWAIEAKCQNKSGIWATYDIPFCGSGWDSNCISNAVFDILKGSAPNHGLFMSEDDWKNDILSKLNTKRISHVYQFGHCISFNVNADETCRCLFWTVRSRLGFSGRPGDVPVICNMDPESIMVVVQKIYDDQIKPGLAAK
jgi:hypothetical protein